MAKQIPVWSEAPSPIQAEPCWPVRRFGLRTRLADSPVDASGQFQFYNVPSDAYTVAATAQGFARSRWFGRPDMKQLALYSEDTITAGNFQANFGLRGDFYNGFPIQRQAEPRAGLSYSFKPSGTVLRVFYAPTQETPFNENPVLSSTGCSDPALYSVFGTLSAGQCNAQAVTPFTPGFRNEFHAGFTQAAGQHLVFTLEYLTKYTHNAYDFSVLGTTPITFPIEWQNSKIPGYAMSAVLTKIEGCRCASTRPRWPRAS